MERLTRPTVKVDDTAAQYMGKVINLQTVGDRLLELILNGPTLNGVNKDVLRHMIRQLYDRLKLYEDTDVAPGKLNEIQNDAYDLGYQSCLTYKGLKWTEAEELQRYRETGLEPEEITTAFQGKEAIFNLYFGVDQKRIAHLHELLEAEQDGRLVVLPCKVGGTVWTNISVQGDRYRKADRPYPVKVVYIGMGLENAYFHVEYSNGRVFPFDFDQIGKNVFLSREEAEKALEGGTHGD